MLSISTDATCGHAGDNHAGGNVAGHDSSGADGGVPAYLDTRQDDGAGAHERALSDHHGAGQDCSRRYMCVRTDAAIVVDTATGVENGVLSDNRSRIDDDAGHHDGAGVDLHGLSEDRRWVHTRDYVIPESAETLEDIAPGRVPPDAYHDRRAAWRIDRTR